MRNFASDLTAQRDAEKIWVFDKLNDSVFETNIRNVTARAGFYQIDDGLNPVSMELALSVLEGKVSQPLADIIKQRGLSGLTSESRKWLLLFCTMQFVRVANLREKIGHSTAVLQKKIVALGYDENAASGYGPMTADDLKFQSLGFMVRSLQEFPQHFANKVCFLLETTSDKPFFISDNPIALHNENDFGPYGNLGLAVPGIEIYFPLTPTLTLTFWDTAVADGLAAKFAEAQKIRHQDTETANLGESLLNAARTGNAAPCGAEAVSFLNSLQVINASRFVMSAKSDFSLAKLMISNDPRLRDPPMWKID